MLFTNFQGIYREDSKIRKVIIRGKLRVLREIRRGREREEEKKEDGEVGGGGEGREIEEGGGRKRGRGRGRGRDLPSVASISLVTYSGKEKGFDVNIEELSNFTLNITYGSYYSTESSAELMFSFSKSKKCNTEA